MKQKFILTLSTLALAMPVVGCAPTRGEHGQLTDSAQVKEMSAEENAEIIRKSRQEGYKAVKTVLDVYVSHLPGKLELLVSNNFLPSKQEFINHIEQSALDKTVRNLEVIVDTAIFAGDKFSVTFDWNRTYMAKGNDYYTRDSGTSNFVFVKEHDGWRLLQVGGADIF